MEVKTDIKGGRLAANHNQSRDAAQGNGLRIRTDVKAGGSFYNHNETRLR